MTPFEIMVRPIIETARRNARSIERILWLILAGTLLAMFAAMIAQGLR
jgi:hypothetical protein